MNKLTKSLMMLLSVGALCMTAVACTGDPNTPNNPDDGDKETPTTYTVTYDLNGGTGTLPTESAKEEGAKFDLAAATGLSNGDKEFGGWNDGKTTYDAGAQYTMPAYNVTFTAQWNDQEQPPEPVEYTLTYDLDGATVEDETQVPQGGDYLAGSPVSLPLAMGFYHSDKIFGGWSDGTTVYPMGYEFTMPSHDTTITAVWNDDELTAADLYGEWTNADGEKLTLVNETFDNHDCVGISSSYGFVYFDGYGLYPVDESAYFMVYGTTSRLFLTWVDYDGEEYSVKDNLIFTQKNEVTDSAELSDFAGKWQRTDTNQPWVITDSGIYYGLTYSSANYFMVGSDIVLYYDSLGSVYCYALSKSDDVLVGQYYAPEKDGVDVTFAVGTFHTIFVNGTPNQIVMSGTPDTDKLDAAKPTAPDGKEFSHWVLVGTDTEFNPSAVLTDDVDLEAVFVDAAVVEPIEFVGSATVSYSFFGSTTSFTITKIVVDPNDTQNVTFYDESGVVNSSFQDDYSTWAGKPAPTGYVANDTYYYNFKLGTNVNCGILIKKDLSGVWMCDKDDEPIEDGEFTVAND